MTDNATFKDAPVSLSEVRSERSGKASDWTPRDLLMHVLRAIDKGEIAPEALVITWNEPGVIAAWRAASPNLSTSIAMLETAKLDMFTSAKAPCTCSK